MSYVDFVISLSADFQGLIIRVTDSPAGSSAPEPLALSLSEGEIVRLADQFARAAEAERGHRDAKLPFELQVSEAALSRIGAPLFRAFPSVVRSLYQESLGRVLERGDELRLRLEIDLTAPASAKLHSIPWEYLWVDNRHFMALRRETSIVRHLSVSLPADRPPVPAPLSILVLAGEDLTGGGLDLAREKDELGQAWSRPGEAHITLRPCTLEALRDELLAKPYHVLHFMGHGSFDQSTGEGLLGFKDETGKRVWIGGSQLAEQLQDRLSLRLVVLNACWTAMASPIAPYAGVATALLRVGIPAVIAMQFSISDRAALAFSRSFYRQIARADTVDGAVTEGRLAIRRLAHGHTEWGTPVLFERLTSGRIVLPSSQEVPPYSGSPVSRVKPDRQAIVDALLETRGLLEHQTSNPYLPLQARTVPIESVETERRFRALEENRIGDPFAQIVHQNIRRVLGSNEGGDSAGAELAIVNRRSQTVHNLERLLLRSHEPLVLLGEPGSGKTLTLQKLALKLIESEQQRTSPRLVLYIRLGELHIANKRPDWKGVLTFVQGHCPPALQSVLDELFRQGRLIVLFDGMDEMSRNGYNNHTIALSEFSHILATRGGRVIFTCRITDFSPELRHSRLVLLPFERAQIERYLRQHIDGKKVTVDNKPWNLRKLARWLVTDNVTVNARNPLDLSLLISFVKAHVGESRAWSASRVELLEDFLEQRYLRKVEMAINAGTLPKQEEAFSAWSRIAWILTKCNRGSAIPVAELFEEDTADDLESVLRAGKLCGVLGDSREQADYQIRFEHHRYQEYFTARWIKEEQPTIDWLEKLGAPRWQETMLNLLLMGSAEEGVKTLASAIQSELEILREISDRRANWEKERADERKRENNGTQEAPAKTEPEETAQGAGGLAASNEPPQLDYQLETSLADRVELGARIISQGIKASPSTATLLKPNLREAVEFLLEHGKPITQVKVMQACRSLREGDLITALDKPLRSPVPWVRNQALLLSRQLDLCLEIGNDLATYEFLPRWAVFFRSTLIRSEARVWLAFALATVHGLAQIVLLLLGTLALAKETLPLLDFLDKDLSEPVLDVIRSEKLLFAQGILSLITLLVALRARPQRIWLWSFGSVQLGLTMLYVGIGFWKGNWESLALLFMEAWYALLIPPWAMAVALVHFGLLAVYLAITYRLPRLGYPIGDLLKRAWQDCGYAANARAIRAFIVYGPVVLLSMVILGTLMFGFSSATEWLSEEVGLPYVENVSEIGLVATILALVYLVKSTFSGASGRQAPWRMLGGFFDGLIVIGKVAGSFTMIIVVCSLVMVILELGVDGVESLTDRLPSLPIPNLIPRSIVLFGSIWVLSRIIHDLLRLIPANRDPFPKGSFTPEEWKARIEASPSREQAHLLLRTTEQSLGLDRASFLELLEALEAAVREGPALSLYWKRRYELDQALKQERSG